MTNTLIISLASFLIPISSPCPVKFHFNLRSLSLATPGPQDKQRFLTGEEMLNSMVLPTTKEQANACGAPKLELGDMRNTLMAKCAGNSMSAACMGAIAMVALLALEPR